MRISFLLASLAATAALATPVRPEVIRRELDVRTTQVYNATLLAAMQAQEGAQISSFCNSWLATRPHTVSPYTGYKPRQVSNACLYLQGVSSSSSMQSGSTMTSAVTPTGTDTVSAISSISQAIATASFTQVGGDSSTTATSSTSASAPLKTTNGLNQELLINGGFDTGDIPPWTASVTSNMGLEVTTGAGNGGQALFAHYFDQYNKRATMLLSQDVTMYLNDTFHFLSDFVFDYGYGLPAGVTCDAAWFINSDYYQLTQFNSSSGSTYQFAIDGLTTSTGPASVNIYLACTSSGQSVDFPVAINDISLVANWNDTRLDVWSDSSRYVRFFSGTGVTQNTLTTGDAAVSTVILRVADDSAAIQACSDKTTQAQNKAFDVHYSSASGRWVCTQYAQAWQSPSLFNVKDATVTTAYGYFLHSLDPTAW